MGQDNGQRNDMQLAAMLWWLTIWYASDNGMDIVPSQQEWLSSELAAAIIKNVTGKEWWGSWRHDESGQVVSQHRGWQLHLGQALDACDQQQGRPEVYKKLVGLLIQFVRYRHQGNGEYTSMLEFYNNSALYNSARSTFIPHQETFRRAQQYISSMSGLCELECFHAQAICKNLAIDMRPYIKRDLAYIKKNYTW